jgi:CO dehydrogenase/acetyl-CoA synthase delta subunit
LLAGCSQRASTRDDLAHTLVESHSALVSGRVAIETLHAHRTTSAAAETAVQDMARQIADAARALEPVTIGGSGDQSDRDLTLTAVDAGEAALLTARDQLADQGDADPAPLVAAAEQVDRALKQIRGSR